MTPKKIGRYMIEGEVGSGGMGIVYEAVDPVLKRRLAVKVMKPIYAANDDVRKRFLREAEAVAGLQHPNIVAIFDSGGGGEEDQPPFMAMEYIEGHDLEQIRKDESLSLPFARKLQVVAEVARGLDHAHSKNVIHRDIKPGNIRIGSDAVKILDFGVARLTTSSVMTQTGVFLGTFYYASPEHFGKDVDGRSDLFSLGVILYELLTEQRPFPGPDYTALIHQICIEDHPQVGEHLPGCDQDLVAIVDKALAKKAEDRYQSGVEMAKAIESYLESLPLRLNMLRGKLSDMADELHQISNDFGHHALQAASPDPEWMKTLAALRVDPEHTVAYDSSQPSLPEDYGDLLRFCRRYRRRLDELNSRESDLEKLSRLFQESQSQFEKAEWTDCRRTVQQILEDYPENPVALDRLRLCEERIGEVERLQSYLEEGRGALREGRHQEALKRAGDVLSLVPDHQDGLDLRRQAEEQEAISQYLDKARQAVEQGDWQSALQEAEKGLAKAPKNEQLQALKNQAAKGLKEEQELGDLLSKAQQQLDAGDNETAIRTAQQGLALRSEHAALIRLVERARRRIERRQRIESLLQESRKAEEEEDFEKALSTARLGLEIEPGHSSLLDIEQRCRQQIEIRRESERLTEEGRQLLQQGSPAEAAERFKEALALLPDRHDLKDLLTRAQEEQGNLDRRDQLLQEAKVEARKAHWDRSLKAAQQGLRIAPGHPPLKEAAQTAQDALARIEEVSRLVGGARQALEAGRPAEALRTAQQALAAAEASQPDSLGAPLQKQLEAARSLAVKAQRLLDLGALRQPVEQARKALESQRFSQASEAARQALGQDAESLLGDSEAERLLSQARAIAKEAQAAIEEQRLAQLLQKAKQAFEEGDFDKTVAAASEVLQADPEHQEASALLDEARQGAERRRQIEASWESARRALEGKRPDQALKAAKQGLALDPNHAGLGKVRDQARELSQRLKKVEALVSEARKALEKEDCRQAEERAQEALKLDSENHDALEISRCASQVLEEEERKRQLQECLEQAQAAQAEDRLEDCLSHLDQARKWAGNDQDLRQRREEVSQEIKARRLFSQAGVHLGGGRHAKALPLLDELIRLRPDHREARKLREECRQQKAAKRQQWMTRLGYGTAAAAMLVAAVLLWPVLFTANSADVGPPDTLPPALSLGRIYQVQPGETASSLPQSVQDMLAEAGLSPPADLRPGRVVTAGLSEDTVQVGINIRPWAWIVSVTRKSDQAGLEFENPVAAPVTLPLPPGDYLLKVRHEAWGEGELELSVPDRPEFTFSADHPHMVGLEQELDRLIKE